MYYTVTSRVTAKEMLTILHSTRSQLGCLPLITISGRCDEMNNEIKKTSKDYDDNDKKVDETLTKVCNKLNIIRSGTFTMINFTVSIP